MARLFTIALGIILTAGIFIGVAAFVADQNPLGSSSYYGRENVCDRGGGYAVDAESSRQRAACYDSMRRRAEATDAQERWLGMGLGVVAVGLFWLLVHLAYFKPRSRRAEAGQTDAAQPSAEPGAVARLWPWHAALLTFFVVGFYVFDSQSRAIHRSAELAADTCILAKALAAGQDPSSYDPPADVSRECYGPRMAAYSDNGPYYVGGGAGLAAALLFLAAVLGWRRATGSAREG